jgi:hypothetical protein
VLPRQKARPRARVYQSLADFVIAHGAPTLAALAAALPPEGAQFAPWGGPAALIA